MESIAHKLREKSDFKFLELERRVRRDGKAFDSMVEALRQNSTVRYIYLCGEFFDSLRQEQRKNLFKAFGNLETLKSIYVANAKLSTNSVLDFSDLFLISRGALEEVSFQHLHIPHGVTLDPMMKALAKLPHLERVEIGVLFMHHNQAAFHERSLAALCRSKSLEILTLIDLRLNESHFWAMSKELETNQSMKELQLWGESLELEYCLAIAGMLKVNACLRSLCLYFGTIDNFGIEAVAQAIGQNLGIRSLSVENEDHSISKQGLLAMVRMLEQNNRLESLSLATKALEDDGCQQLCKALQHHPTLKQLSLDNVIETEDGWDDVGTVTSGGSKPKDSIVGPNGLVALSAMLKVNNSLEQLDLTGLAVDDLGVQTLTMALKDNTTLRELSLGSMHHSDKSGSASSSDELVVAAKEEEEEKKRTRYWKSLEDLLSTNKVLERVSTEEDDPTGDYIEKIDLLATLNRQQLRTQMVDVNTTRTRFVATLIVHRCQLDVLYYLLSMNPNLLV